MAELEKVTSMYQLTHLFVGRTEYEEHKSFLEDLAQNNSDLTGEINAFLKTSYEDGTIHSLASQYGIESAAFDFADK